MARFRPPVRALVGTDFSAFCKQVGERLELENEERLARQREEAAKYEYEGSHLYYVMVGRVGKDVKVSSIEEFPLVGRLEAAGRSYEVACTNLRMLYALTLHKRKLLPDLDTARQYAAKCIFKRCLTTGPTAAGSS